MAVEGAEVVERLKSPTCPREQCSVFHQDLEILELHPSQGWSASSLDQGRSTLGSSLQDFLPTASVQGFLQEGSLADIQVP